MLKCNHKTCLPNHRSSGAAEHSRPRLRFLLLCAPSSPEAAAKPGRTSVQPPSFGLQQSRDFTVPTILFFESFLSALEGF